MINKNYEYSAFPGIKLKIFGFENPAETIDPTLVYSYLMQIYENLKSFTGTGIYSGLTIEVWDYRRSDIPEGIKKNSGLTWIGQKLIQLNSNTYGDTNKE